MSRLRNWWPLMVLMLSSGCYHATVETGLPPSNEVIAKPFASSWIYGLVPPSAVETAAKCPHGVARVETQLSFVNQLVSFLTAGIYTPMEIKVTCAERSSLGSAGDAGDLLLADGSSEADLRDAFALAIQRSLATKGPVYVQLP